MREITKEELAVILKDHEAWLKGQGGAKADLSSANLRYADLSSANLSSADLSYANLRSANLDFSAFPLWCGGLNAKIDKKIAIQLLFHALSQDCDDKEYQAIRKDKKIIKFLKQFHRINEVKKYWE